MRLILVRHGQTPANVAGVIATSAPGPGLTELGHRQAAQIPAALRNDPIDAIFVSTLQRTRLTATPLAEDRGLELIELPGIHEIEAGDLEGRTDHDAVRQYLGAAFAWGMGDRDATMPGAPDGHAFFARFDTDVAAIAERLADVADPTAVIVSHGAALRVWVAASATNVPPSFAGEHELDNTGIVELSGSPEEGWTLLSWQGMPVGGPAFVDAEAEDPTGESLSEAEADAR